MGEVISPNFLTTLDVPVANVCEGAKTWTEVLIVGIDEHGSPTYACSYADSHKMLWTAERFAADLLAGKF